MNGRSPTTVEGMARPAPDAGPGARGGSDAGPDLPPGVPEGVLELARSLCDRLPPAINPAMATGTRFDPAVLVDLLTAPLRLDGDWPAPEPPLAVKDGWVQIEVTDDDRELLEAVLARWPDRDPERLARSCQELRLPVSPFRPPAPPGPAATVPTVPDPTRNGPTDNDQIDTDRVARSLVIDLSTHWAGPLATKLLAEAGATVIKVDPRCRRDGFASRPGLYQHLNRDKQIIDLDLRSDRDRRRFENLLTRADLLVESFSRRVMANLGYGPSRLRADHPRLSRLSIKAYPAGSPESDWLGFGPGVHASSGLGLVEPSPGRAAPRPAAVAYPDFLTGLAGFGTAVELLGRQAPRPVAEVSLAATIAPLVGSSAVPRSGWAGHG